MPDATHIYVSHAADADLPATRLIRALREQLGADRIVTRDEVTAGGDAGLATDIETVLQSCLAVIAVLDSASCRADAFVSPPDAGAISLAQVVSLALSDDRILVIPVLIEHAEMPAAADLPRELVPFAALRPVRLTADRWEQGVEVIVQMVQRQADIAALLARALEARDRGDFAAAEACVADVLSRDPAHVQAIRLRAQAARAAQHRAMKTLARDVTDRTRAALAAGDCEGARRALEPWPAALRDADLEQVKEQLEQSLARAQAELSLRVRATRGTEAAVPAVPWMPPAFDENVQFTVFRRSAIQPERWYPLLVFAHLSERRADAPPDEPDPMLEVQAQANQVLGDAIGDFRSSTEDSGSPVARDGELRIVPRMEGVTFNPPERRCVWTESVHREDFRLRADASMQGRVARGTVTVFAGNLILADVQVSIRVDRQAAAVDQESSHARAYRRIFASYSHRDTRIVEEFEAHAAATGDKYLRDVVSLRAGEVWDQRLLDMIRQADVFQLFWSWNALASPLVREEWQQALALNRPYFVRPVYWEDPLPEQAGLPPDQLRRLHFQRVYPRTAAQTAPADHARVALPRPQSAALPDTGIYERPAALPAPASPRSVPRAAPAPPIHAPQHTAARTAPQAPAGRTEETLVASLPEPASESAYAPTTRAARTPSSLPSATRLMRYGSVAAACVLAVGLYVTISRTHPGYSSVEDAAAPIEAPAAAPATGGGPPDPQPSVPQAPDAAQSTGSAPASPPAAGNGTQALPPPPPVSAVPDMASPHGTGGVTAHPSPAAERQAQVDLQRRLAQARAAQQRAAADRTTVAAAPIEREPATTPSADARPSPSPDASAGIEATIRRYEAAWAQRDLAALQRLWLMPDEQARALKRVLSDAGAISVTVHIQDISVVSDARAVVRVQETRSVTERGTTRSTTAPKVFHLANRGGNWIIVAIEGTR